jgi:hypothetical protein
MPRAAPLLPWQMNCFSPEEAKARAERLANERVLIAGTATEPRRFAEEHALNRQVRGRIVDDARWDNVPEKIETDRDGNLIMSPPPRTRHRVAAVVSPVRDASPWSMMAGCGGALLGLRLRKRAVRRKQPSPSEP